MAKIERLTDLLPGAFVISSEIDNELNQIINLLSGLSLDKHIEIQFSHATLPALTVTQTGSGPVAKFFSGATLVAQVPNSLTPSAAEDLVTKTYADARVVPFAFQFFFPGNCKVGDKSNTVIVPPFPAGSNATGLTFKGHFQGGGGGTGTQIQLLKNGTPVMTVVLTGTLTTVVFTTSGSLPLATDDILSVACVVEGSTRSNVTVELTGTYKVGL